mgnify:FL=1|jgi:hypothetical protein
MLCQKSLLLGFGLGMFVVYIFHKTPDVVCETENCNKHSMLEGQQCKCPS